MMSLDTKSWPAFEYLRDAQLSLSEFERLKDRAQLEKANQKLGAAIALDPNYLRAFYYRALVNDMLGQPRQAAEDLQLVLTQDPVTDPSFVTEVRYNLGVATFHQYGHKNLQDAIKLFDQVMKSTNDSALQLRAHAGIAHAYAVMMIPAPPEEDAKDCEKVDVFLASKAAQEHVSKYHNLSLQCSDKLKTELDQQKHLSPAVRDEIRWRWRNTCAVQRMFYTDYFEEKRIERLREAEEKLKEADEISPKNWSIKCNIASTYMRLGYWLNKTKPADNEENKKYFETAIKLLDEVLKDLYPDYGFALYEKARVYRLEGDFEQAETFLRKAEGVPARDRAVGNTTLKCELHRVDKKKRDYPFIIVKS